MAQLSDDDTVYDDSDDGVQADVSHTPPLRPDARAALPLDLAVQVLLRLAREDALVDGLILGDDGRDVAAELSQATLSLCQLVEDSSTRRDDIARILDAHLLEALFIIRQAIRQYVMQREGRAAPTATIVDTCLAAVARLCGSEATIDLAAELPLHFDELPTFSRTSERLDVRLVAVALLFVAYERNMPDRSARIVLNTVLMNAPTSPSWPAASVVHLIGLYASCERALGCHKESYHLNGLSSLLASLDVLFPASATASAAQDLFLDLAARLLPPLWHAASRLHHRLDILADATLRWLWRDWPAEGELDVLLSPHALLCTASVPVSEIVGIFALAKPWLIFEAMLSRVCVPADDDSGYRRWREIVGCLLLHLERVVEARGGLSQLAVGLSRLSHEVTSSGMRAFLAYMREEVVLSSSQAAQDLASVLARSLDPGAADRPSFARLLVATQHALIVFDKRAPPPALPALLAHTLQHGLPSQPSTPQIELFTSSVHLFCLIAPPTDTNVALGAIALTTLPPAAWSALSFLSAIATVVRTFATSLEQYRPAVFALVQLLINGLLLVREDRTLKLDLIHGLERTLVQAVASALRALPEPTVTYLLTTPRMRAWHDRGLQEGLTMSALDTAVAQTSTPKSHRLQHEALEAAATLGERHVQHRLYQDDAGTPLYLAILSP